MRTATVYNFLIEANIMASIAILLMIIVRRFFRKRLGNRAIYFAWALVAVRLLCPLALPNPAINEIRPEIRGDQGMRPIADQVRVRLSDAADDLYDRSVRSPQMDVVAGAAQDVRDAFERGTAGRTALAVYLIGTGVTCAWFVFLNVRFRLKLKAGRIEPISGKLLEQYNELCAARGVKPVPVYFTDPLPSACVVGVIKPYIALPLTAKPQDAINVLQHEVCHVRGGDHLIGVIRLLCCAVHWFNPLVWLASDMSRTDGELACDDRVVDKLDQEEKVAYANVLVLAAAKRCAPGPGVLATGMTMTGRKLKTRVSAILHRDQFKRGLALAFMIVSSMLLVCAFATDEVKPSFRIPVLNGDAAPRAAAPITSEEEAIDRAKAFFSLPTVHLSGEIEEIKVSGHENGLWTLNAYADQFDVPAILALSDAGEALYYNHYASGWDSAGAASLAALTGDHAETVRHAEEYALHFALAVLPGDWFSNPAETTCLSASKLLDNAFLTLEALGGGEEGDFHSVDIRLQASPVVRVVYYRNHEALNRLNSSYGAYAGDQSVGTTTPLTGYDENVGGFRAMDRRAAYASYATPGDNDIALEKALDIAVAAVCQEFGESKESLAARYAVEYGFVSHAYAFYQAPYWEFHFIYAKSGEALYAVYVHSPDGEILEMESGNG